MTPQLGIQLDPATLRPWLIGAPVVVGIVAIICGVLWFTTRERRS